jgi:hypothetical protein
MRKKIGPFISGMGAGLCLAAVILALWGLFGPDQGDVQAGGLNQDILLAASEADEVAAASIDLSDAADLAALESHQPGDAQAVGHQETAASAQVPGSPKTINISPGMSARQIAALLEQEGVIDSAAQFHDLVVEQKKTQKFIAGKFYVRCGAPYEELITVLTSRPNT